MLSSLPTELLRDIIEATVPHAFNSTTYDTRQQTLCSISLVSRRFRSIAQPLPPQVVSVKSVRQLESLPSSINEGGGGVHTDRRIKAAVFTLKTGVEFLAENVKMGFRRLKNVESLTLDGYNWRRVDLALMISFQNLSSLHLSGCKAASTEPVILPSLRSLTLFYVDTSTTVALLNPVSLPRLEELAWFDQSLAINLAMQQSGFHQLLPQLGVLTFDRLRWKDLEDAQFRLAASRTLIDYSAAELFDLSRSTRHPVHLRVHGLSYFDQQTLLTTFSEATAKLTSYIELNPSLPLRSVYLTCADPSTVHLSSSYVQVLSRVCQQRNIDLIFETGPSNRAVDPCFSPDFSRRMKEQRRRVNAE